MRNLSLIVVVFMAGVMFIIPSCNKGRDGGETKISRAGGTESHNMGQNCMNCHKPGGKGEGWFTAAGTVYNTTDGSTFSNSIVQLFTQPRGGGQLVATLNGDANGNFYTTANINFGSGLYPAVTGVSGTNYMPTAVTSGACNSCHGPLNATIFAY